MKSLKKCLKWFLVSLGLLITLAYVFDYDYILKGVRVVYFTGHDTAFIDDHSYFENDIIEKSKTPEPWPNHVDYNKIKTTDKLSKSNEDWGTVAYVIIKNDSVWHESYYDGFNETSKTNSFSMAKSITSAMLGKAIMEGHIKSLDQPISVYYPKYKYAKTTVGDLSSMASGLDWIESYTSPFSVTARANYDDDLAETILNLEITEEPGVSFKYLSGSTALLGMIIEKATGMPLADYLAISFWQPMGATQDALWQLDDKENKLAKTFCCISSNAKDFARFGKLYKEFGKWNGKQLLDSVFVAKSIKPRFPESPEYGYGWWLHQQNGKKFYMMRGHLGQYVIVQPEDNLIITRLGHEKSPDDTKPYTEDISVYIDEAYKMLNSN
jgi:CubicO group peptidase (beta-lactamase class C family)